MNYPESKLKSKSLWITNIPIFKMGSLIFSYDFDFFGSKIQHFQHLVRTKMTDNAGPGSIKAGLGSDNAGPGLREK